jgi:hypothetical protein
MTIPESGAGFERHAGRRPDRGVASVSSGPSGGPADPSVEPRGGGGWPTAPNEQAAPASTHAPRLDLNASIAAAVRGGYEVVEKNIAQARDAAQKFRQGELSAQQASKNTRQMLRRAVGLGRQTAAAWFDLAEHLLDTETRTRASVPASGLGQVTWPPFSSEQPPSFYEKPVARHLAKTSKLQVRLIGRPDARLLESRFQRTPTPLDLTSQLRLKPPGAPDGGAFIDQHVADVRFDLASDGEAVVAEVRFKAGTTPGVYGVEMWQEDPSLKESFRIGWLRIKVGDQP